jgi:DNA-binding XRE family transcriptional regulator
MKLRQWMREQRVKRDLNQAELAKLIGVNETTISNWETGRSKPQVGGVISLAKWADVDVGEIARMAIGGEE